MSMSAKMRSNLAGAASFLFLAGVASAQDVTYAEHVAPILMENCVTCHRPGEVAPMSLLTYEDARRYARQIGVQVSERRMPPWHAAPDLRDYTNDRSLDDAEIDVIEQWVATGAKRGADALAPPIPTFNDSWQLGEPDLVLSWDSPYQIAADGDDEYRCFVLDPKLESDQWVDLVEVIPGNRTVDHHIVIYIDQGGTIATRRDEAEPGEGYTCFGGPGFQAYMVPGWGPGYVAAETPAGSGYLLEAGAKIVVQMHYHKNGTAQEDLTRVGLRYARRPPQKVLYNAYALGAMGFGLRIPAGESNHVVTGQYPISEDITIHSLVAHMHYLGKAMDIWATLPDGTRVDLVTVPRFDFYWQTQYGLAEPQRLPAGSVVHMEATFDNSPESPYQHSNPPREVTFGEATTDEMAVAVFFHTRDAENLSSGSPSR
jgi:mono/diheme cytochrome c family protein